MRLYVIITIIIIHCVSAGNEIRSSRPARSSFSSSSSSSFFYLFLYFFFISRLLPLLLLLMCVHEGIARISLSSLPSHTLSARVRMVVRRVVM